MIYIIYIKCWLWIKLILSVPDPGLNYTEYNRQCVVDNNFSTFFFVSQLQSHNYKKIACFENWSGHLSMHASLLNWSGHLSMHACVSTNSVSLFVLYSSVYGHNYIMQVLCSQELALSIRAARQWQSASTILSPSVKIKKFNNYGELNISKDL